MRFLLFLGIAAILTVSGCVHETHTMEIQEPARDSVEPETTPLAPDAITEGPGEQEPTGEGAGAVSISFSEGECSLDGDIFYNYHLAGKTKNSVFNLTLEDFRKYQGEEDLLCILGTASGCTPEYEEWEGWRLEKCWIVDIPEDGFYYNDQLAPPLFINDSSMKWPKGCHEYTNFVKPERVSDRVDRWREIGMFTNDTRTDIEFIWKQTTSNMQLIDDSWVKGSDAGDYWKMPDETWQSWGDCEDWSNLFISLIKAYNSSAECYAIDLPIHITIACKIGKEYLFYDQYDFWLSTGGSLSLESWLNSYFTQFGIEGEYKQVLCAYDDRHSYGFSDNAEFLEWLENERGGKSRIAGLFS